MGGTTNAYTSYDRTVYYINTGAGHWRDALDLLLSYVSENVVDAREVAREKKVIQQEMKMGESNPNTELWKLFIQTAYQENPVRYPVIGYEEVFVKQSREALLDYYQQRYQPENVVVALSGNVQASEVLEFVAEKTKNFLPGSSDPVVLPEEPLQGSVRWEEKEVPIVRLVQAMIGFPSVNAYEKDLYALGRSRAGDGGGGDLPSALPSERRSEQSLQHRGVELDACLCPWPVYYFGVPGSFSVALGAEGHKGGN